MFIVVVGTVVAVVVVDVVDFVDFAVDYRELERMRVGGGYMLCSCRVRAAGVGLPERMVGILLCAVRNKAEWKRMKCIHTDFNHVQPDCSSWYVRARARASASRSPHPAHPCGVLCGS